MEIWRNMSAQQVYAEARQQEYLKNYVITGSVKRSLEKADVPRATYARWRRDNLYGFKDSCLAADQVIKDELQDIALERVRSQKPGDSASLLVTMLKAFDPERYDRENRGEVDEAKELMKKFTEWARSNRKNKKSDKDARDAVSEAEKIMASGRESSDDASTQ